MTVFSLTFALSGILEFGFIFLHVVDDLSRCNCSKQALMRESSFPVLCDRDVCVLLNQNCALCGTTHCGW